MWRVRALAGDGETFTAWESSTGPPPVRGRSTAPDQTRSRRLALPLPQGRGGAAIRLGKLATANSNRGNYSA